MAVLLPSTIAKPEKGRGQHAVRWGEVNLLSKFQHPSTYGLGVNVFWTYFQKGWLSQLINQLISDKGVCRIAPATSGLLMNVDK